MSVVEFSADAWQASAPGLQAGIAKRMEAVSDLAQGLGSLAGSDNIGGQGADAMRAYIQEVHLPITQSLLISLATFQTAIGVYWNGYRQVDTNGNFRLVKDEYDTHLTQLDAGMEQLRGYAASLRSIASGASHLVALGGAGAGAADRTVNDLEAMHRIAKGQKEAWEAYEASDPGFIQVQDLLAELNSIVKNVGTLTVGQGRKYTAGSFNLSLGRLGELTSGMLDYCEQNQQVASDGWEKLFSEYAEDVEAARKEEALKNLIWDGLQIVAGAVITVIGVGLTPFTGGFSLGLTVLGGSMLVGGVNSAVNHVSIATSGQELNLVGQASEAVGQWYDVNVAQPAADSGSPGLQFLAGVGSGVGQVVSEAASMNVHEIGQGVQSLITDPAVREQLWKQLKTTAGQVAAGDTFVIGQLAGNVLVPGAAASKLSKTGGMLGRVGKVPDFGKPIVTVPGRVTSAIDTLAKPVSGVTPKISKDFTPTVKPTGKVDLAGTKQPLPAPVVVKPFVDSPYIPGQKKNLLPNVQYRSSAPGTNHKYIYETNADGLIDRVTVRNLHYKPDRDKLRNATDTPGKIPGDEAGHLIADMFDGSPALENLVSQAMKVNRGAGSEWAAMERAWRDALNDVPPKSVTNIEITVLYDGGKRPTGFDVSYKIDGSPDSNYYPNPIPHID